MYGMQEPYLPRRETAPGSILFVTPTLTGHEKLTVCNSVSLCVSVRITQSKSCGWIRLKFSRSRAYERGQNLKCEKLQFTTAGTTILLKILNTGEFETLC